MLQQYFNSITRIHQVYGLECHIKTDQSYSFSYVLLQRKGDQLIQKDKKEGIQNVEEVNHILDKSIPIALTITGKGVLSRAVSTTYDQWADYLSEVLPNAKTEQFIGQVTPLADGVQLSFSRKDLIINIINQLRQESLQIIHFSLGLLNISSVLPLLEQQLNQIPIHQTAFSIEDGKVVSYKKISDIKYCSIVVGGDQFSSQLLPAFSVGFQALLELPIEMYNYEEIQSWKTDYWYEYAVRKGGWGILVSLLVLLLINFGLFSYYDSKNQQLGIELSYYEQQLAEMQLLENQLNNNEKLMGKNNLLDKSKTSFYADQIAAMIPAGISLRKMQIFPAIAKSRREKEYFSFDKKSILLSGENNKVMMLNLWIKQLEGLDWIEEVKVLPYKEQNGVGQFDLELVLSSI